MITNEYTVTKQLYMKWFREGQKKGVQLRITIMWACIIIVLLISAIVFFNISTADPTTPSDVRPWLLVEAAFVLYSIYHLFFRRKIAASNMYEKWRCSSERTGQKRSIFVMTHCMIYRAILK